MRKKYDVLVQTNHSYMSDLMIVESTDSMIFAMHIAADHLDSFDTVKCQIRVNHTLGRVECWRTVDLSPLLRKNQING